MRIEWYLCLAIFLLLGIGVIVSLRLDEAIVQKVQAAVEKRIKVKSFKHTSKLRRKIDQLITTGCQLVINSNIPITVYCVITAGCSLGCFFAGRLIFASLPVSLAMGTLGLVAPLLLFKYREGKAKNNRLERLCSSMIIISNSYAATEDFVVTVRENLEILDYPEPFKEFLTYVTLMDSNIEAGLRRMEQSVNNPYFAQWTDALVLSQEDRSLKYVVVSVVDSMHDVLQVQAEADAAMYAVWRDYLLTLIMIFSVPLIFKITLPDVYVTLTTSAVGQGMFILLLAAVVYSVLRALKINRPLMM